MITKRLYEGTYKTDDAALFAKVKEAIDKIVAEHELEPEPAKTPAYMRAAPKEEPSFEQGWWQASAGPGVMPSAPVDGNLVAPRWSNSALVGREGDSLIEEHNRLVDTFQFVQRLYNMTHRTLGEVRAERDQLRAERDEAVGKAEEIAKTWADERVTVDQLRKELADQERLVRHLRAKNNRSYVSGQIAAAHDTIDALQKKSTEMITQLGNMPEAE